MSRSRRLPLQGYRATRGLSLIELMIAMVLGLLVVGAAIGIFMSNRQTYRATESLARVQENARTAFELMARDVREAGGNPCVNTLPIANVLNSPAARWWTNLTDWGGGVRGYRANEAFPDAAFGGGAGDRVNGTEAIQLLSGDDNVVTISAHNTGGTQFTLNRADHGFAAGDLLIACNSRQASIFQATAVGGVNVTHGAGGTSPGNCTANLGLPVVCGAGTVFAYAAPNSVMVKLHSTRWYIGNNGRGGRSLYQARLQGGTIVSQEVAEGVRTMQVTYLVRGDSAYSTAQTVTNNNAWGNVVALRIDLGLEDTERTEGNTVRRNLIQVASLRNRNV